MKILFCASEATPYAKSGGLADVMASLPAALAARGHDVRLLLPRYGWIARETLRPVPEPLVVHRGPSTEYAALLEDPESAFPVYLVEHDGYFHRPWPYGPPGGAYADNCARFSFLSAACLATCRHLDLRPDVIHVNDWHTALVPLYLRALGLADPLRAVATVLTVHNIGYQGEFPKEDLTATGLGWERFTYLELERNDRLNLLKGGLVHATRITTVSPTHAWEITTPEGGFGLDGVLAERRGRLTGILNGIDSEAWDPRTDPFLPARFEPGDLSGKAVCKAHLQQEMGLPARPEVPLYGLVTRLTYQKGTDVVATVLGRILELDVQVCLLGAGDPLQELAFLHLARRHPERFAVTLGYHEPLAHRIEAGADFFLMPSRYEPCGLNQMYSQRYGTLPIVRGVGGLVDTVESYDEATGEGTGFVFADLNPESIYDVVGWATWAFYNRREQVTRMQIRAMQKDFSWDQAAEAYERIYAQAASPPLGI